MVESVNSEVFSEHFEEVRRRLQRTALFMLGNVEDAGDVVQETAFRAWRSRQGFQGRSSFATWVLRICINLCRSRRRRRRLLSWLSLEGLLNRRSERSLVMQSGRTPEEILLSKEGERLVWNVVESLPAHQLEVFVLHYDQELTPKEIAQVLKLPDGTVRSRLHYARKSIIKQLDTEVGVG